MATAPPDTRVRTDAVVSSSTAADPVVDPTFLTAWDLGPRPGVMVPGEPVAKGSSVLILAPHMDDEVLGCSSFMHEGTTVLYFTDSGRQRYAESQEVLRISGAEGIYFGGADGAMDLASQRSLVGAIEKALNKLKPATVLVPAASHHQDHQAVFLAAQAALRAHESNHRPRRVLVYEGPGTEIASPFRLFNPCLYRILTEEAINHKTRLLDAYGSQSYKAHLSAEVVLAIAAYRGSQVLVPYAEAFEVLREVE